MGMKGPSDAAERRQSTSTFATLPLAAVGAKGIGRSQVLRPERLPVLPLQRRDPLDPFEELHAGLLHAGGFSDARAGLGSDMTRSTVHTASIGSPRKGEHLFSGSVLIFAPTYVVLPRPHLTAPTSDVNEFVRRKHSCEYRQ